MKLVLKNKFTGARTLVNTNQEKDWQEKYIQLDGSPLFGVEIPKPVIVPPVEPSKEETTEDRFAELKAIGYQKLDGELRKEYKELKKLLQK